MLPLRGDKMDAKLVGRARGVEILDIPARVGTYGVYVCVCMRMHV